MADLVPRDPTPDETEAYVLGAMLQWNESIGDVLQIVSAEDFRADRHQRVFAAIAALFLAGKPIDLEMLANALKKGGDLENVGGYPFLAELLDLSVSGTSAVHHALNVRENALVRRLRYAGQRIVESTNRPFDSATGLLETAEKEIFSLAKIGLSGSTVSMQRAVIEAGERIDARVIRDRSAGGVQTGFIDLDDITAGLQDSEFIVVAARPSVGKTALGLALVRYAAVSMGLPVLVVSLEQTRAEIAERMLCSIGSVNSSDLRRDGLLASRYFRLRARITSLLLIQCI